MGLRRWMGLGLTICAVGALQASAFAGEGDEAPVELRAGAVVTGETPHRILHFTFDDGPDPTTTPPLLEALDRNGVRATFFFSASRFASRAHRNAGAVALAREVAKRGHHVGSHSFDHLRMAKLPEPKLRLQLDRGERAFTRVLGAPVRLFRPPWGSRDRLVDRMLAKRGYTTVLWNVGLADWVERPPDQIAKTFWKIIARNEAIGQRGGIVLMHDSHPWSAAAFEAIAGGIAKRNCELLAKGEQLYDIVGEIDQFATPPAESWIASRQALLRTATRERCVTDSVGNAPTSK